MANRVVPDQMLHPVASDLGLHCLLRPLSKYLGPSWCFSIAADKRGMRKILFISRFISSQKHVTGTQ